MVPLERIHCTLYYFHQKSHEGSLHPQLGGPGREEELSQLCSQEEERHAAALKLIADHSQGMRDRAKKSTLNFMTELAKHVKVQLHLMDSFIYPSEVTGKQVALEIDLVFQNE